MDKPIPEAVERLRLALRAHNEGRTTLQSLASSVGDFLRDYNAAQQPDHIVDATKMVAQQQGQAVACTCPSGDGSLRWPCPAHPPSSPVGVAYLDIGVGGYMDLGTEMSDEELAKLPNGRHVLGIIGTHGVDGYTLAQQPAAEVVVTRDDDGEIIRVTQGDRVIAATTHAGGKQPAAVDEATKLLRAYRGAPKFSNDHDAIKRTCALEDEIDLFLAAQPRGDK